MAVEIGDLIGRFCEPVIFVVTRARLDVLTSETLIVCVVHVALLKAHIFYAFGVVFPYFFEIINLRVLSILPIAEAEAISFNIPCSMFLVLVAFRKYFTCTHT